jgi:hypothetical protein
MVFNAGIGKEAQMSRRDLFLVAGTAAISSLLTYFTVSAIATPPDVARSVSSATSRDPVAVLTAPDVRGFPDKPEPVVAAAPQQHDAMPHAAHRADARPAPDASLAVQKQRELGERFSSFYSAAHSDPGVVGAKVESRFYLEEWNEQWAGSREKSIRTLFEADQELGGLSPQITCRSKNCQVVLAASNQTQVQQLSAKFMHAATRADVGMNDKVVTFFPDVSTGRVVFYLSENGNTELFQ